MAAAFWVTLSLIGVVCGLRIIAGMGKAHHRRWEASEPECVEVSLSTFCEEDAVWECTFTFNGQPIAKPANKWETIAGHADTVDELIEASR